MRRNLFCCMTAFVLVAVIAASAYAVPQYLPSQVTPPPGPDTIIGRYGAAYTGRCDVCHLGGPPALNPYGSAYSALPHGNATQRSAAFTALEASNQDADGDGFTNLQEFQAGTFPGDPLSKPTPPPDTTPPTVTTFTIPATSSSLTVSYSIAATDTVGVTGYLVTESATTPSAAAVTGPASGTFTFATAGAKTLYAWARDAAGNVSSGVSASVTITLPPPPDTTLPTVTSFTVPTTSNSLTVPIQSFAASDNVGVTGFMVTSSSVAPAPTDTGWNAAPPPIFVAGGQGSVTLFAWAKDAAGNVSAPLSATVTIALAPTGDTQAPTTPALLSASTSQGGVTLTWSASIDNVGVSGYLVFRNGVQISTVTVTSFLDSAALPLTSYTYTVRATDATGNVSGVSNAITVTTPAAGGGSATMPLPTGGQVFTILPTAAPVLSLTPAQALPFGLGTYATGGSSVALIIGLDALSGPADIYFAVAAPVLSPEIFVLNSTGAFQPVSAGLVPWKKDMQPAPLNVTILPELPMSSLPPGRYTFFLAVTPVGSTSAFYLWDTTLTIGVPWQTSLSGAEMVPPVSTTATGVANFSVNPATGGLAGTLTFTGLSSSATQAHIHEGATGTNGAPIVTLIGGAGSTSGVWTVPPGAALSPGQLSTLRSGGLYFVVHSSSHGSGEIRGQIVYPVVRITKTVSGAEAVPPVTTSATGTANLEVNIDTGELSGTLAFTGLSNRAAGAHLHLGSPSSPGPQMIDFEGGDGLVSGTYRLPVGATLAPDQLAALANDNTYLALHVIPDDKVELAGRIAYPAGAPRP